MLAFQAIGTLIAEENKTLTGYHSSVAIKQPTRLDWKFVASGFGKAQAKVPTEYRSTDQRFQMYVPTAYSKDRLWPLIINISPGDAPRAWNQWKKVCTEERYLFCSAYGAGNRCPVGKRTRIVLDMFDQMRREYLIDPQRTYLTGFSGGGRMACTIAFALPEYFGGLIPVCGTNPLNSLDYLRQHVRDRLSVALVTGEKDFNRAENEKYMYPLLKEMDTRTKLWVVKELGHSIPKAPILLEVVNWLEADVKNRRKLVKEHLQLLPPSDVLLTPERQSMRLFGLAKRELKKNDRIWRGVTLMQGILSRWPNTESADEVRKLLKELQKNPRFMELVEEQGGEDERRTLKAQANAFQRMNQLSLALEAWKALASRHPKSPEGTEAFKQMNRIRGLLANTPYLGVRFAGGTTVLAEVVRDGPADKGKLERGDRIIQIDTTKITTGKDLRTVLDNHKPGDELLIEVNRQGQVIKRKVTLGKRPS